MTKSRAVQVSLLVGVGAGIALSLYDSSTDAEEKKKVQSQEQKKIVPVIPKVSNMPIVSLPDVNFFMEIVTGIQFYITLYSYSLSLSLSSIKIINLSQFHFIDSLPSCYSFRWLMPPQESKENKPHLVVLGSGWAAVSLLKTIDSNAYDISVVSPRNYFLFTPMLPGNFPLNALISYTCQHWFLSGIPENT